MTCSGTTRKVQEYVILKKWRISRSYQEFRGLEPFGSGDPHAAPLIDHAVSDSCHETTQRWHQAESSKIENAYFKKLLFYLWKPFEMTRYFWVQFVQNSKVYGI